MAQNDRCGTEGDTSTELCRVAAGGGGGGGWWVPVVLRPDHFHYTSDNLVFKHPHPQNWESPYPRKTFQN